MSGETEERPSGWTTDTLHELVSRLLAERHLNVQQQIDALHELLTRLIDSNDLRYQQRFDAQEAALSAALTAAEKAVNAALLSAQQAVNKAETAAERRFESVNEFRGQLSDQVRTFVAREYLDSQLTAISERLSDLALSRQNALDEARAQTAGLLPREVFEAANTTNAGDRQQLRDRIASLEGEVKSSRRVAAVALAALGVGFTILTLVLQVLRL